MIPGAKVKKSVVKKATVKKKTGSAKVIAKPKRVVKKKVVKVITDPMVRNSVALGSDPELLCDKTVNGSNIVFPVIGLIGGTKENPRFIDDSGFRGFQEDNVALEYTTHPTVSKAEFVAEQTSMYLKAVEEAEKVKLTIHSTTSASYNPNVLLSHAAKTFGCEPSFDVYTNSLRTPPLTATTVRSAGGHIHISYSNPTESKNAELAKMLDVVLTINALAPRGELNAPNRVRRQMYGLAGEIRHKSYGFEYRTPGNMWVRDPSTIAIVWDAISDVFKYYDKGRRFNNTYKNDVINRINRGDSTAQVSLNKYLTNSK